MPRSINTDSGWTIPDDWDGESWACVELQWPDSDQWRGLLRDLMYSLTRGRSWSKDTGTITAVQPVGWEVFNRNWPLIECGEPILDEEDNCVAFLPRDDRIVTSIEPNNPFTGTGDVPDLWNSPPMLRGNQVTDLLGVTGVQDSDLICWPLDLESGALDFIENILTLEWEIPRFKVEWDGPATVELHLLQIPNGGYAVIVPDSPLDTDFVLLQSTTLGSFFDDILGLIDSLIEGSLYSEYIYEYQTDDPGPHKLDVYFIPYIVPSLNPLDLFDMGWGGGLREVVICQDDISIPPCEDCPDCPDCPDGPGLPDDGQWPDYISAGIGGVGGGCCSDESEDCMANLGPCPPIRIQDGVLQFFWCCQWVDIGNVGDIGVGDEEPPDVDPPEEYSACGKADAIVSLLYAVADSAWDERISTDWWAVLRNIQDDVGYPLDYDGCIAAVRYAQRLEAGGVAEATIFDDTQKQFLKCQVAGILGDDYGGFDDDDFAAFQSMIAVLWSGDYSAHMQLFWESCATAMGKNNADTVAKLGSLNLSADCECPSTGDGDLASVVWRSQTTVTREDGTYSLLGLGNQGQTLTDEFVTEAGSFKALEITHYIDVLGDTNIDDILICIEPAAPVDELLHKTWISSAAFCTGIGSDSFHGHLDSTDRATEDITVADSKVWVNATYSVSKSSLSWVSGESRSCPQSQAAPKTYQWKMHIARVNGTDTGVVAIPAGV